MAATLTFTDAVEYVTVAGNTTYPSVEMRKSDYQLVRIQNNYIHLVPLVASAVDIGAFGWSDVVSPVSANISALYAALYAMFTVVPDDHATSALQVAGNLSLEEISTTGFVSRLNSTDSPLGIGATYNGTYEDISPYSSISVIANTDVPGTLYYDFSTDGTNLDRAVKLSSENESSLGIHSLIPIAKYGKARLVNGGSAQGYLRLQTLFSKSARIAVPTSRPSQDIGLFADLINTRTTNDVNLDTAKGTIAGRSVIRKFGASANITPTLDVIQGTGAAYAGFLTTAATVRVKAGGNVADTAAGVGARSITIVGLDQNFEDASETVVTNGALASAATTTTFIRVFRAYVGTDGTYSTGGTSGSNVGDVTIETSGGITLCVIIASLGQTQLCSYTVPAGKTAYITGWDANADGTKSATFYLFIRENANTVTAPYSPKRMRDQFSTLLGSRQKKFSSYTYVPEKSDIWVAAFKNSAGTTTGDAGFELILQDNY